MTPVLVLSEGLLANSSEPWRIPAFSELEPIAVRHPDDPAGFQPYSREEGTLARPWVIPGTPGMEHRLGGLEKQPGTGAVSYAPEDHAAMCAQRRDKVASVAEFIPDLEVTGPAEAPLLVLSWGGTRGAAATAIERLQQQGRNVAHAHLRYLNPFPHNLGDVLRRYRTVMIPELNHGQLAMLIRARYLVDVVSFPKLEGRPFTIAEIQARAGELLA
jgi:2-oxoglutarate ferredoxin oxidoreductase subunit alpha